MLSLPLPPVLIDKSAWGRLGDPHLPVERATAVGNAFEAGQIVASLPFALEVGYSARSEREHHTTMNELFALPWAVIDAAVERRALDAQRRLARAGHHRLPPNDVLLAALADEHRLGILHYDHHYDLIAEKTDLTFASIWLAEPGSL